MSAPFKAAIVLLAGAMLVPSAATATDSAAFDDESVSFPEAPQYLLASLSPASMPSPAYASQHSDLMFLDNGVVLESGDLETPDGYTSGFRLTASFSPAHLSALDIGAEFTYRESEEVPMQMADQALLMDTTTMAGSLLAGIRFGQFGLYAKTGFAEWEGDPVTRSDLAGDSTGTARIQGFGARLKQDRLESRLEFEEIDAPNMAHLNLLTASIHYAF